MHPTPTPITTPDLTSDTLSATTPEPRTASSILVVLACYAVLGVLWLINTIVISASTFSLSLSTREPNIDLTLFGLVSISILCNLIAFIIGTQIIWILYRNDFVNFNRHNQVGYLQWKTPYTIYLIKSVAFTEVLFQIISNTHSELFIFVSGFNLRISIGLASLWVFMPYFMYLIADRSKRAWNALKKYLPLFVTVDFISRVIMYRKLP